MRLKQLYHEIKELKRMFIDLTNKNRGFLNRIAEEKKELIGLKYEIDKIEEISEIKKKLDAQESLLNSALARIMLLEAQQELEAEPDQEGYRIGDIEDASGDVAENEIWEAVESLFNSGNASDRFLPVKELAERYGVSQPGIYNKVRSGEFKSIKNNVPVMLVSENDVKKFAKEKYITTTEAAEMLNLDASTIRGMIKNKKLNAIPIKTDKKFYGNDYVWRIKKSDVTELAKKRGIRK